MTALENAEGALALADVLNADDPAYALALRLAQVHATLAVAEEQRTANLLALWNARAAFEDWPDDPASGALMDLIDQRLGGGL